ncbi:AAA domain-containing protein, partial [Flavobacterium sp.]|uniref:AAA domain-containing protein n=1 Tax=Flavobacterium sp. TaxID=239 RepID=UPI0037BE82E6
QISKIENITTNVTFSDIINNETKYLLDIQTYLSFISDEKVGFFKRLESKFKKVSYLEDITINGIKTNTKQSITKLKKFIETICLINKNFNLLKTSGYTLEYDDKADIESKLEILKETISKVERNNEIVKKIQSEINIIEFSKFVNIDKFEIEELTEKAIECKDDFDKLKKFELQFKNLEYSLAEISLILENSKIKKDFNNLLPIHKIADKDTLEKLFIESKDYLRVVLPLTFEKINEISFEFITKENFEFANANYYLIKNEFIDIQKTKEEISIINEKIYETKCEILFDLAKDNFRSNFSDEEKQDFINLLKSYNLDYNNSLKKGIKDNAKFQISVRKKSIEISKNLSCWIMKFNDVLNSVGQEPEIFDCIIVDEASQLDFNSLLLGYYAKSMIVVGDDKQTSPNTSMIKDSSFNNKKRIYLDYLGEDLIQIRSDTSLFDLSRLVAGDSDLQLNEHFRCVPELIEFSKKHFYNNNLRALKQINGHRLNPKICMYVENSFIENQVVLNEITSIYNYLKKILVNPEYKNKTIGVVSLGLAKHTLKLKEIKIKLLDEFSRGKLDFHKLIIEEPSKFQGDERDVMLVSLGVALDYQKLNKNENAKPYAIVDAQDEKKKINVALSRAKEQMILFHSLTINDLKDNDFRLNILNFFNDKFIDIKPLVLEQNNAERNQYNIAQFDGYMIGKKFDSWFEYDIASELIKKGFSYIEPQYVVKASEKYHNPRTGQEHYVNFKLDLVVHNNGKRVAIECDGDPFHSLPIDVAYDIERQEFLERVGWKVYRILYSAYKKNRSIEVEKMINFIIKNTKVDEVNLFVPKLQETLVDVVEVEKFETIKKSLEKEEKGEPKNILSKKIVNPKKNYKHKSFIDKLQDEMAETRKSADLFSYSNNFYVIENGDVFFTDINIPINSKIIYQTEIKDFQDGFLFLGYENGNLAKFKISLFAPTSKSKIYIKHGVRMEALKFIHFEKNDIDVAILSKNGKCIVYDTKNMTNPIKTKTSLGEAKGINIIKLKGRDVVEHFVIAHNTKLTENAKEYFKKDSRAFGFYLRKNDVF